MSITCTRCRGTGFLNDEQFYGMVDDDAYKKLEWLKYMKHMCDTECTCTICKHCHVLDPCPYHESLGDIKLCDCCSDGVNWYGEPGQHYSSIDPKGSECYEYNGGLCECH